MSSRSRALAQLAARAAAAASKEGSLRSGGATASIRVVGRSHQSTLASSGASGSKGPLSTPKPSGTRGAAASAMPAVQEVAEEAVASSSSSSSAASSSSSSSSQFLPFARAHPVTAITTNVVGAVSPDDGIPAATSYRNEDGARIDDGRYRAFLDAVGEFVPAERVFQDPLRTFAYSTDASFYRLVPKAVIKVSVFREVLGEGGA